MLHRILPVLILLAIAPSQELTFAPREGGSVRTSIEREVELAVESFVMLIDGEEMPGHGTVPESEVRIEERFVFLDRYEEVAAGRVTRLVRTYEELASRREEDANTPTGPLERESQAEYELEGLSVEFGWDEDDGSYTASFAEGEGDEDLLEGLWAELDFRQFLPAEDVSEGDAWDVPGTVFAHLAAPGGDLVVGNDEGQWAEPNLELARAYTGEVTCTSLGERTVEDRVLQAVGVTMELSAKSTDEVDEGERTQEFVYELEGELLWDAAAGHLHSLELAGRLEVEMVLTREVEMGERTFETESTIGTGGSFRFAVVVEDA